MVFALLENGVAFLRGGFQLLDCNVVWSHDLSNYTSFISSRNISCFLHWGECPGYIPELNCLKTLRHSTSSPPSTLTLVPWFLCKTGGILQMKFSCLYFSFRFSCAVWKESGKRWVRHYCRKKCEKGWRRERESDDRWQRGVNSLWCATRRVGEGE